MTRHRSSASPLAGLYAALIVYASLYPFAGWRDPGISPWAFLALGWPRWWTWFDLSANLLGYIPFGALIFGALVRTGSKARPALTLAFAGGLALSLAMEWLQNFLPRRVSSNVDLGLNALGTLCGAVLGWMIHRHGGVDRWQVARDRWFIRRSAGALALLLLWPAGLLLPLPVPLGVGQVLARVQEAIANSVQGTAIAPAFESWIDAGLNRAALSPAGEFALIALGLLAPCMIAFSVAQPGWRRLVLAFGAAALGGATTTLSTVLNFGPEHALAWRTPQALAALGVGLSLAALLSGVPRRAAAGLGLMVLTALVTIIAQAPADPYFAQSLSLWEQGRFIRFHGAARWVGWLWPYAAIVYLLARLGARDEPAIPPSIGAAPTGGAGEAPKMGA
ncbi:MAG: VanZ family protein [Burkholderiaceae bacterium]